MILCFCRPPGFSTGFANDKSTSAGSRGIWLQFELVRDDPRNTVLMIPPPLSHYYLEGKTEEELGKLASAVEMASLDDEVRVSHAAEQ